MRNKEYGQSAELALYIIWSYVVIGYWFGYSTRYYRVTRLVEQLLISKGDGSYSKLLDSLNLNNFTTAESRELLEVIEDRNQIGSTIIAGQILIEHWAEIASVIPARVRKPKDKPLAENGVLIAERWIVAKLRNQVFLSFYDLNKNIEIILEDINNKPFQKMKSTRRFLV
jgi:hypothetical protein